MSRGQSLSAACVFFVRALHLHRTRAAPATMAAPAHDDLALSTEQKETFDLLQKLRQEAGGALAATECARARAVVRALPAPRACTAPRAQVLRVVIPRAL
jgi:hypothetical protein